MTNKREKTIVIVLNETEKKQIQDYAAVDHMEVSPWCRMQIQKAIDRIEDRREARIARLKLMGSDEWEEQGIGRRRKMRQIGENDNIIQTNRQK